MCYIFKCLVLFVIFLYLCKFFIVSYCGWFCFSVLFFVDFCCFFFFFFFFFQAEDGIRDGTVTGVQTCALPISSLSSVMDHARAKLARKGCDLLVVNDVGGGAVFGSEDNEAVVLAADGRSEERRVGKEGRSRWAAEHEKKKKRERSGGT